MAHTFTACGMLERLRMGRAACLGAGAEQVRAERDAALCCARHLWRRIKDPNDATMLVTHNAYLKLYALTEPLLVG